MKNAEVTEADRRVTAEFMYTEPFTASVRQWIATGVALIVEGDEADYAAQAIANARREGELRGEIQGLHWIAGNPHVRNYDVMARIAELERELAEAGT